jgi:hypothetical protein
MLSLVNNLCMFVSMLAYVSCAIHIHYDGLHHDMCPFYSALAVAATIHFIVAVARTICQRRDGQSGDNEID